MRKFIPELEDAQEIKYIFEPELLEEDAPLESVDSFGVYKLNVLTDKGIISLVVKPISKIEARYFLAASVIGVSPSPAVFIENELEDRNGYSEEYLIYRFFEGMKLSKICAQENAFKVIKDNLWIVEELGVKLASLKKAGIEYKDFVYYNTIVNLETRNLVIIDYGDRNCIDPFIQMRYWWLPSVFSTEPQLLKEVITLFEEAYQRGLDN